MHQIVQRLLEDEDEDAGDWKEVTSQIAADRVERWVYTQHELENATRPTWCSASEVFYAEVEGCEREVLVQRDGTVTDRWGDGSFGVPQDIKKLANEVETLIKPSVNRKSERDDVFADSWLDVYVDKEGGFLGFVDPQKAGQVAEDL